MTLHVSSDLEARLEAAAHQHATDPSSLAGELLTRALESEEAKPQPSAEALLAGFKKLAVTATPVRNYPEDFFSRDVIYADHD